MVDMLKFKDGSNIWFTSDHHFNDDRIRQFCSRPFGTVAEMDQVMIDNWNRAVGKDDIVFHLGDFCLGGSAIWAQVRERLNGHIYLCMGNHDLKNMRPGFARLFEAVTMQYHLIIEEQQLYLNHNPFLCYGGSYSDVWQLFGHVHSRSNNTGKDRPRLDMIFPTQYDVGVDNNGFAPVSFYQVKDIIMRQIEESKSLLCES